jgi:hypothetical protein
MKFFIAFLFSVCVICNSSFGQEELLDEPIKEEKVMATFKTTRIVNAHSVETVKKKTLDFRITHHFGDVGGDNGGGHSLFGLDNAADIRIAFEYGINDRLTAGFGRSKIGEMLDAHLKFRLFQQTTKNSSPVSLTLLANTGFTPVKNVNKTYDKFANRFSYTYQLLLARKFNKNLSLQLIPSLVHRNVIFNTQDKNDLFSLGIGGRYKFTKRFALLVDYFYTFSDLRQDSDVYSDPLGVGVEIETGGHVFHIFFTNNSGIVENTFIPNTTSSWTKGEFKLGFNISRVFSF